MHQVESEKPLFVEAVNQSPATILLINDSIYDCTQWINTLHQINPLYECYILHTASDLREWICNCEFLDLEKIQLIVADQFYDDHNNMSSLAHTLMLQIRDHNPKTWIIETSYSPSKSKYIGIQTNSIIDTEDDKILLENLLQKTHLYQGSPLSTIFSFLLNDDLVTAEQSQDSRYHPDNYFYKIWHNPNLSRLEELLGIDSQELKTIYKDTNNIHQKRSIIHGIFTVLGHLDAQRNGEFYDLPLQRLKVVLGIISQEDETD